jgi:uncharacterized membrane protein
MVGAAIMKDAANAIKVLFWILLFIVGLWLLWDVSWRVALGVFLFTWVNNLVYSHRLKELLREERRLRL